MTDHSPVRWFAGQARRTRIRVRLRWATCPFGSVGAFLPPRGRVLDWGCGHGLLTLHLAAVNPEIQIQGCEIDEGKVRSATVAAERAGLADRVAFETVGAGDGPSGTWDAIVLCDVLYLQTTEDQESLVRDVANHLGPDAVLLCKELGPAPRWKRTLCRVQEQVSVRILRITRSGSALADFPDPTLVASWMADEGLVVEQHRIDRGYHAPHVAVVGRRPSMGAASESGAPGRGW